MVTPWYQTNVGGSHYQFGVADYFDRIDPIETSPGSVGSPVVISQVFGNYNYFGYEESSLFQDSKYGNITDGDVIHLTYDGSSLEYIKLENSVDRDGFKTVAIKTYVDSLFTTPEAAVALGLSYKSYHH